MNRKYEIPLLYDSHNHTGFYAALNNSLDVRDIKDYDKVINTLKKLPDKINLVMGWTFLNFNRNDLEALPPVLICDQMLHSFIINSKAKSLLKKDYPAFVENIDNSEWIEKNLSFIFKLIPQIQGINKNDISAFFTMLEAKGIYKTDDMLAIDNDYISLINSSKYSNRCNLWTAQDTYRDLTPKNKCIVTGIKLFLDGALGPETAATRGYTSGKAGLLLHTDNELLELLKFISKERLPASIHSVGERGLEQLLRILQKEKFNIPFIRIEHAMFITKELAIKCKEAGLILSMQPNFSFDSILFKGKLTDKHLAKNNPFRMLIDEVGFIPGNDLIFNSDGMPYGAETALESAFFPPYDSQRLTLEEMIKGYCLKDKSKGKIIFEIENKKIINMNVSINRQLMLRLALPVTQQFKDYKLYAFYIIKS